jgi:hypothetical protein
MRLIAVASIVSASLGLGACSAPTREAPAGASLAEVRIEAQPTPAWIFVDGSYVGSTPIEPEIAWTHATRFVEVVAVPMHPSQTRQVLRLVPPALPAQVTFFLDNQDPRAVTR